MTTVNLTRAGRATPAERFLAGAIVATALGLAVVAGQILRAFER